MQDITVQIIHQEVKEASACTDSKKSIMAAEPRMWPHVILAASALVYRLSWPLVNSYALRHPQDALYSLTTKFVFVFSGLSCFAGLCPALTQLPRTAGLDRGGYAKQLLYYCAVVLCLVVTTINFAAGWRWALVFIEEYFTRGLWLEEPSRFNRGAAMLCSLGLSLGMLAGAMASWARILLHCWTAWRAWLRTNGKGEGGKMEKVALASDVEDKVLNDGAYSWTS